MIVNYKSEGWREGSHGLL